MAGDPCCSCGCSREIHLRVGSPQACQDVFQSTVAIHGWRPGAPEGASTSKREVSTRERIMKMRADGMRWEALLCAAKKGSQNRAEELLNKALSADESAARVQGEDAVSRAKRRGARLTEAFQRCLISSLCPSIPLTTLENRNCLRMLARV